MVGKGLSLYLQVGRTALTTILPLFVQHNPSKNSPAISIRQLWMKHTLPPSSPAHFLSNPHLYHNHAHSSLLGGSIQLPYSALPPTNNLLLTFQEVLPVFHAASEQPLHFKLTSKHTTISSSISFSKHPVDERVLSHGSSGPTSQSEQPYRIASAHASPFCRSPASKTLAFLSPAQLGIG